MQAFGRLRAVSQRARSFVHARPRLSFTLSVAKWLPLGFFVIESGFHLKTITGKSMQPTLNPNDSAWKDIVLFDRFSILFLQRYHRGDVVALKSPSDNKLVVKRIIALEGDTVQTLPPYPDKEVVIPQGRVWVEGDETFHTEDSNYFGPVPLALIDSKLSFILWPPERFGPIDHPTSTRLTHERGSPAWRKRRADVEREQWRNSRVTRASSV